MVNFLEKCFKDLFCCFDMMLYDEKGQPRFYDSSEVIAMINSALGVVETRKTLKHLETDEYRKECASLLISQIEQMRNNVPKEIRDSCSSLSDVCTGYLSRACRHTLRK